MSRHRNIRSMNYSEEYEGFDDVYGHSVEDDHCISPSEARFLYDRTRHPQMSAFISEENDITEEDEHISNLSDTDTKAFDKFKPNRIDEEKLRLGVDKIQDVIGDMIPVNTIQEVVVQFDYDVEKALDHILSGNETFGYALPEEPLPQRERIKNKDRGVKTVKSIEPLRNEEKPTKEHIREPEVPSITIVPSGVKTKGFEITESNKTNTTLSYPKCHSPSGRASPNEAEDPTRNLEKVTGRTNVSSRASRVDVEKQYKEERGDSKEVLHMVVIGHVDAGKSTLMGHVLYALGQVNKKTMHKYEQESKKIGKQSFVYAWILDETGEERSRGITMDVGQSKFETKTKIVNLLDAPGHKDFIPNMITGATQADVAVLVVDATRGEFETGFESGGQTREHTLLVRSLGGKKEFNKTGKRQVSDMKTLGTRRKTHELSYLDTKARTYIIGVSQLAVVINKLDTVGWSEERFLEIQYKLGLFLKQAGYRESDVTYVPCSGLAGENLIEKPTQDLLSSWYKGPCLLEVIDNFKVPERPLKKPLRVSVSDVYKGTGSGFCVSGHVETGMVQAGDKVLVMPQNEQALVKGISIDEVPVQSAFAGDGVSITLANYDIQHISVGCILSDPSNPVPTTSKFEAKIVVFNVSVPITAGYPVILHMQSLAEQAVVVKLVSQLNKSSGEVLKNRPRCLTKNSNAVVEIETSRPICLELYRETKELGRFMLRVGGVSIAAGLVTKIQS